MAPHHEEQLSRDRLVHLLLLFLFFLLTVGLEESLESIAAASSAILLSTWKECVAGGCPARRARQPSPPSSAPSFASCSCADTFWPRRKGEGGSGDAVARGRERRHFQRRTSTTTGGSGSFRTPSRLPPELTSVCSRRASCVASGLAPQPCCDAAASSAAAGGRLQCEQHQPCRPLGSSAKVTRKNKSDT